MDDRDFHRARKRTSQEEAAAVDPGRPVTHGEMSAFAEMVLLRLEAIEAALGVSDPQHERFKRELRMRRAEDAARRSGP